LSINDKNRSSTQKELVQELKGSSERSTTTFERDGELIVMKNTFSK